jgi:peptide/nickel transport system permease protein
MQYVKWVFQMVQGNFELSLETRRPVAEVIGDRLALTMVVTVPAILFAWR